MMQAFKDYYKNYQKKQILLALLSGLIFALFIMSPILALIINVWLLFLYRIYLFSFILVLGVCTFFAFWILFMHLTLAYYHEHKKSLRNKIILTEIGVICGVLLGIGIILMLWLIPIYT